MTYSPPFRWGDPCNFVNEYHKILRTPGKYTNRLPQRLIPCRMNNIGELENFLETTITELQEQEFEQMVINMAIIY